MVVEQPNDPCPVPFGTFGTVTGGNGQQVWVKWDDGRTLNLLVGEDRYEVITKPRQGLPLTHEENVGAVRSVVQAGADGALHYPGDTCFAQHYTGMRAGNTKLYVHCGQDFMAGTICSLFAGHDGPCAAECPFCGNDWIKNPLCSCLGTSETFTT